MFTIVNGKRWYALPFRDRLAVLLLRDERSAIGAKQMNSTVAAALLWLLGEYTVQKNFRSEVRVDKTGVSGNSRVER